MSVLPSPRYRGLMIAAAVMAALGWPGVILVVTATLPTVGPRWLFFFLWSLAITGTSLPFLWILHRRFDPRRAPAAVLLRQGVWVGLFASVCVWLQINRNLSLTLAVLIGGGLAAFEWLIRLRERSLWRPES